MSRLWQDKNTFQALAEKFGREKTATAREWMLTMGLHFLGSPYSAHTLEKCDTETLVVNLQQFDCFTYVENCVALARTFSSGDVSFEHYSQILESVRYRHGRLNGYASRLHYFSDWLYDNTRRGILKNIGAILNGQPFSKRINYISTNAEQYPALHNRDEYRKMRAIEKRLSQRVNYYIPKTSLKKISHSIADGDIIAYTSRLEGLDVSHVGIAIHLRHGLYLLHASSTVNRVGISGETICRELTQNNARTGIMVARIADFAKTRQRRSISRRQCPKADYQSKNEGEENVL